MVFEKITEQKFNQSNWFGKIQSDKALKVSQTPLPNKKDETWKYTPSKFLKEANWDWKIKVTTPEVLGENSLFFNGEEWVIKDLPKGIKVSKVSELDSCPLNSKYIDKAAHLFSDANLAYTSGAILLTVDTEIETPLKIIYKNNAAASAQAPYLLVLLKKHAKLELIEINESKKGFVNSRIDIELEAASTLNHTMIQTVSNDSQSFTHANVHVSRDATYNNYNIHQGASLSRNTLDVHLVEENASCDCLASYDLKEDWHNEHITRINHHAPHTFSKQVYKGILDGKSTAVFNGIVKVGENCQGVQSEQLNKTLLLSDEAMIHSRPTLLIDNDDVKCAHGSTIGQLDPEEIFYLESRGIKEERAKELLAKAFTNDVFTKVPTKSFEIIKQWIKQ